MKKTIILISFVLSFVLVNLGMSTKSQVYKLRKEELLLQANNLDMRQKIKDKGSLKRRAPVLLSGEYGMFINQVRALESYSGTNMDVQLEKTRDADDISDLYVETQYKGVKGLRVQIVVDKYSDVTDMGAVLDDIHLLEKNTDFMASEIRKENGNLIVKGEIYGI